MLSDLISVDALVPIQAAGIHRVKLQRLLQSETMQSIPVFPYENKFIMADGHTRAFIAFLRGTSVNVDITDPSSFGAGAQGLFSCFEHPDAFLKQYFSVWRPACLRKGITSIGDYLDHPLISDYSGRR